MVTSTKKVVALATVIIATGVAAVEFGRDAGQTSSVSIMTRDATYAATRVDTAFDLAAALPSTPTAIFPMAMKGDLPVPQDCLGLQGDAQAECMDVAYEPSAEPSIIVETGEGTTTTLMRMDATTVAGMAEEALLQSE